MGPVLEGYALVPVAAKAGAIALSWALMCALRLPNMLSDTCDPLWKTRFSKPGQQMESCDQCGLA